MKKFFDYENDIRNYLSFYPKCNFLYIGIDGVPSVGKMIEQQDRRYKGYLISLINKELLLKHKNQLDNNPPPMYPILPSKGPLPP